MSLLRTGPLDRDIERRIGRRRGGEHHDLEFLTHNLEERLNVAGRLVERHDPTGFRTEPIPATEVRTMLRELERGLSEDIRTVHSARWSRVSSSTETAFNVIYGLSLTVLLVLVLVHALDR